MDCRETVKGSRLRLPESSTSCGHGVLWLLAYIEICKNKLLVSYLCLPAQLSVSMKFFIS